MPGGGGGGGQVTSRHALATLGTARARTGGDRSLSLADPSAVLDGAVLGATLRSQPQGMGSVPQGF